MDESEKNVQQNPQEEECESRPKDGGQDSRDDELDEREEMDEDDAVSQGSALSSSSSITEKSISGYEAAS